MYEMMNGWTMWGIGSGWFLGCILLLGILAVFAYAFFSRRG